MKYKKMCRILWNKLQSKTWNCRGQNRSDLFLHIHHCLPFSALKKQQQPIMLHFWGKKQNTAVFLLLRLLGKSCTIQEGWMKRLFSLQKDHCLLLYVIHFPAFFCWTNCWTCARVGVRLGPGGEGQQAVLLALLRGGPPAGGGARPQARRRWRGPAGGGGRAAGRAAGGNAGAHRNQRQREPLRWVSEWVRGGGREGLRPRFTARTARTSSRWFSTLMSFAVEIKRAICNQNALDHIQKHLDSSPSETGRVGLEQDGDLRGGWRHLCPSWHHAGLIPRTAWEQMKTRKRRMGAERLVLTSEEFTKIMTETQDCILKTFECNSPPEFNRAPLPTAQWKLHSKIRSITQMCLRMQTAHKYFAST